MDEERFYEKIKQTYFKKKQNHVVVEDTECIKGDLIDGNRS